MSRRVSDQEADNLLAALFAAATACAEDAAGVAATGQSPHHTHGGYVRAARTLAGLAADLAAISSATTVLARHSGGGPPLAPREHARTRRKAAR